MSAHFTALADLSVSETHWLWAERVPLGAITTLEGMPGCGKSLLIADLAARLTTGRAFPECEASLPPSAAILMQAEDRPETTRSRVEAAEGDLQRVLVVGQATSAEAIRLPRDFELLADGVREHRAKLLVIDPASAWFDANLSSERSVRQSLGPLANLAAQEELAIIIVRHLTKSGGSNPIYRGAGSIGLIGAARSGLLVAADPLDSSSKLLAHFKSNVGELATTLRFAICNKADVPTVDWRGRSTISPQELSSDAGFERGHALREAIQGLFAILGDGPLRAGEVEKRLRQAGINTRTLRRAKECLGIVSKRQGFGPGSVFYWQMDREHELVSRLWAGEIDVISDQLFHGDDTKGACPEASNGRLGSSSADGQQRSPHRGDEDDPDTTSRSPK